MRYYYKDENNNYYNFKSPQNDLIAITEQEFDEHNSTFQAFEIDEKLNEIAELKQLLANTDYQAIKYAEGEISAEEYAPIKNQRRLWRQRINELEET